jgi:hypothetical protein
MKNEERFDEDILRNYLSPEGIEKAPDGFSSKVMSRINLETRPEKMNERSLVLPVSAAVTALLVILTAFLVPGGSLALPDLSFPEKINFSLPDSIFGLIMPDIILYLIAGGVLLAVFDAALKGLFNREKS